MAPIRSHLVSCCLAFPRPSAESTAVTGPGPLLRFPDSWPYNSTSFPPTRPLIRDPDSFVFSGEGCAPAPAAPPGSPTVFQITHRPLCWNVSFLSINCQFPPWLKILSEWAWVPWIDGRELKPLAAPAEGPRSGVPAPTWQLCDSMYHMAICDSSIRIGGLPTSKNQAHTQMRA